MKLGWCRISKFVPLTAVFLSLLSPSLWALDFDKEIAKQNSQVSVVYREVYREIQTKSVSPRGQRLYVKDQKRAASDFDVELTPIKR